MSAQTSTGQDHLEPVKTGCQRRAQPAIGRRPRRYRAELKKAAASYPGTKLHVICDNYSIHKHAEAASWRIRWAATPPCASNSTSLLPRPVPCRSVGFIAAVN
jgi:hypothetical protein